MRILGFIAQDDPAAALRLIEDLRHRVSQTLSIFPEAGAKLETGQRQFTVRRHAFVYQYDSGTDTVTVLDVFGPGEDWR
jgi:plasmid stabilization system protein ParE